MDNRHKILADLESMRKAMGMSSLIIFKVFVKENEAYVFEAYEHDARTLSPLVDIPIFNEDGLTLFSFPENYLPEFLDKLKNTKVSQVFIMDQIIE